MIVVHTQEAIEGPYSEEEIYHLWSQDVVSPLSRACLQRQYDGAATQWSSVSEVVPRLVGSLKSYLTVYVVRKYILKTPAFEKSERTANEDPHETRNKGPASDSAKSDNSQSSGKDHHDSAGSSSSNRSESASLKSPETPEIRYARILGLSGRISKDDIKKRYRELAKKYHPDRVDDLGDEFKVLADKRFKEINEAFEHFRRKYSIL